MKVNFNFIKYFSPLIGILFCPVTFLLFWSVWSDPFVESETTITEELNL